MLLVDLFVFRQVRMKKYLLSCYNGICNISNFLFAHISFKLFMKKLFVLVTLAEKNIAQRRQERQSKTTILSLLQVNEEMNVLT